MKSLFAISLAGIALAIALSPLGCNANDTSPVTPSGTASAGSGPGDLGAGDPGPGGVRFAASGEALALTGYAFPPASVDNPAFVDGWEVRFTHLLTTIDDVTLYDSPDTAPGDQSRTGGVVVQLKGPWAVDLARSDPTYLPGKGSPGELAVPFASVAVGNDGNALKTDGTRYGFGYDLVAATGRSGAAKPSGGTVYVVDVAGSVRRIAHYAGPGGADEVEIAPTGFGTAARAALVPVDAGATGRLVAVAADGTAKTIARFADGPNPIAAIVSTPIHGGGHAGLYLADTLTTDAFFAPASELRAYTGDVIVGSEIQGLFWVVRPRGRGYEALRVPTTLRGGHYNLEGMTYTSP